MTKNNWVEDVLKWTDTRASVTCMLAKAMHRPVFEELVKMFDWLLANAAPKTYKFWERWLRCPVICLGVAFFGEGACIFRKVLLAFLCKKWRYK